MITEPTVNEEDKTLAQFLREHPAFIHDLTAAAFIIRIACGNKKNYLTDHFLTIAEELKPYNNFFKTLRGPQDTIKESDKTK